MSSANKDILAIFDELLQAAKTDGNIVGFFLTGSRGKGNEYDFSDYDIYVIVKEGAVRDYKNKFETIKSPEIDLGVMSVSEFAAYARWQGSVRWDRYSFAHVKALVDKTGEIQKLIDEKGSIPSDKRDDFINGSIDAYINGFFRSVKSFRRQNVAGFRLEAAASIPYLLDALFALRGRTAPFLDYLAWELQHYPLEGFSWTTAEFLAVLLKILENGDLKTQQKLAIAAEAVFRAEGHGSVFDAWAGKDKWAMNF